jgi:hypothetical protein
MIDARLNEGLVGHRCCYLPPQHGMIG